MSDRRNQAGWLCAVALVWISAWWHSSLEWRSSEQYQFAWAVPFLFIYAAYKRWGGPLNPTRFGPAHYSVFAIAWIILAEGELLRWQDPVWRLTVAMLTLGATLLTMLWFLRVGGLPLLRRQLFPLVLAWLAVPWPAPFENWITQKLLGFVTGLTVMIVNDFGVAALRHGNVIELTNGMVGIEEACSGIRSLQASLMVSLFLGEFFALSFKKRCGILLGGGLICVLGNLLRVLSAIFLIHVSGAAAAAYWHDTLGGIASVLSFLAIGLLAFKFASPTGELPENRIERSFVPGWDGIVAFGCVGLIPLVAWAIFAGRMIPGDSLSETPRWMLESGHLPTGWSAESVEPSEAMKEGLRFSQWTSYRVRSPRGWTAQVIYIFWAPGARLPSMAFSHTPALCMSSVGWSATAEPQKWTLPLRAQSLPCVAYPLEQGGSREVVIQSLSVGGKIDHFLWGTEQTGGTFDRLLTNWRAPLSQVNEDLLIFMPDLGNPTLQKDACSELLDLMLLQNRSFHPPAAHHP